MGRFGCELAEAFRRYGEASLRRLGRLFRRFFFEKLERAFAAGNLQFFFRPGNRCKLKPPREPGCYLKKEYRERYVELTGRSLRNVPFVTKERCFSLRYCHTRDCVATNARTTASVCPLSPVHGYIVTETSRHGSQSCRRSATRVDVSTPAHAFINPVNGVVDNSATLRSLRSGATMTTPPLATIARS